VREIPVEESLALLLQPWPMTEEYGNARESNEENVYYDCGSSDYYSENDIQ